MKKRRMISWFGAQSLPLEVPDFVYQHIQRWFSILGCRIEKYRRC